MSCSPSTRAWTAGLLWSAIGLFLVVRGLFPYLDRVVQGSGAGTAALAILAGLAAGVLKGLLVLARSSRRVIARIEARPGKAPLWSMFPTPLLLVIPLMIGLGLGLRHLFGESSPALVLGIYVGIGAALLASSWPYFRAARSFADASEATPSR
jgi:drug/metabolite transporter (DMT)-like permease